MDNENVRKDSDAADKADTEGHVRRLRGDEPADKADTEGHVRRDK